MADGGIYQLLIHLTAPAELRIGGLGCRRLAAGWYVYTGSMRRGLEHRLARHQRREKPLRWHIDYLTSLAGVVAVRTWPLQMEPDQECRTHQALLAVAGVSEPVQGFGSSDCRCRSHLAYLGLTDTAWHTPLSV